MIAALMRLASSLLESLRSRGVIDVEELDPVDEHARTAMAALTPDDPALDGGRLLLSDERVNAEFTSLVMAQLADLSQGEEP